MDELLSGGSAERTRRTRSRRRTRLCSSDASIRRAISVRDCWRACQLQERRYPRHRLLSPCQRDHVHRWREALGDPGALDAARVDRWLRQLLLGTGEPPRMHPAVSRAIRGLRERITDYDDASLEGLARVAGLSGSRLMHLFTQSVGVPLRPYVRWLRLQRAAARINRRSKCRRSRAFGGVRRCRAPDADIQADAGFYAFAGRGARQTRA